MKIIYGNELVQEVIRNCNHLNRRLWLAVHFIGQFGSTKQIIGDEWLKNKAISIRLLLDSTHLMNIDMQTIELFCNSGEVKVLPGMHAKIYIFDDKCIITSANLTETAFTKRYEIGIIFNESESENVIKIFEAWWLLGTKIDSLNDIEYLKKSLILLNQASIELPLLWRLPPNKN